LDAHADFGVSLGDVEAGATIMDYVHDFSSRLILRCPTREGKEKIRNLTLVLVATFHGARGSLLHHAKPQAQRHYRNFGVEPGWTIRIIAEADGVVLVAR
jgi:hypothetical protein